MDTLDREQLREEGFCIFPEALTGVELDRVRSALAHGLALAEERDGTAHDVRLDPNAANLRVYDLPVVDPVFIELLRHHDALAAARAVLGRHHLMISNFTANVALPGSLSMRLHSDQALVIPSPWAEPWAVNVIWCLDDIDEENGATRYLPGSHRYRSADEVPADAMARTRAFSAPAGSFIVMEGRLWHTSGANVSKDRQRRMLFAYYSADFIRPQANWNAVLPAEVQASLDDEMRDLFGLGPMGNVRVGGNLTRQ